MRTKYSISNKNKNKRIYKNKNNKTNKNRNMRMNMKGGADPICDQLTELRDKNIFNVFRSAVQLPKITLS
jgi:hypothetical protein